MSDKLMSDERSVRPCHACGADCEWCAAANRARAAFPRATVPPRHDAAEADDLHHCVTCFLRLPALLAEVMKAALDREEDTDDE